MNAGAAAAPPPDGEPAARRPPGAKRSSTSRSSTSRSSTSSAAARGRAAGPDAAAVRQVRSGADRAAAERRRRGPSPLLAEPEQPPPAVPDDDIPRPTVIPGTSAASMLLAIAGQLGQSVLTALTEAEPGLRTSPRADVPTADPPEESSDPPGELPDPPEESSGQPAQDRLLQLLEFLRARLAGDFEVDEFGFDPQFADAVPRRLLRPLYEHWFRVEVSGAENIPVEGGALIVSNHSGTLPMDALMTALAVREETGRHLRILGGDLVFQTPFLAGLARRGGATLAAAPDAERLLSTGNLLGVWPEGYKGIGKPFSQRYKLQRFGRGGFVSTALRTGVPIIPCSVVGAEEIYPIIAQAPGLARLLGLPYLPVTPTFPALGPLGAVPLPSKWLIEFGTPVSTADLGPAAAEDPILVFDLTDRIRRTIQQTLYELLVQRRSVFF